MDRTRRRRTTEAKTKMRMIEARKVSMVFSRFERLEKNDRLTGLRQPASRDG
jgi:hypothetical protein